MTKAQTYDIIETLGCLCKLVKLADCKSVPTGLGVRVPRHPFMDAVITTPYKSLKQTYTDVSTQDS